MSNLFEDSCNPGARFFCLFPAAIMKFQNHTYDEPGEQRDRGEQGENHNAFVRQLKNVRKNYSFPAPELLYEMKKIEY